MAVSTNRESDKFIVRLPEGMRDAIRRSADAKGRSMNAEIVARLRGSLGLDEIERERAALRRTLDTLSDIADGEEPSQRDDTERLERKVQEVADGLLELEASMSVFMESISKRQDRILADREKG